MTGKAITVTLFFVGLFVSMPASSQMEGGQELVLSDDPDLDRGTVAVWQGITGDEPDRYFVQNLNMLQPASVILMSGDADRELELGVAKYRYDEPLETLDTSPEGFASHEFRTQGEAKFTVSGDPGVAYLLLVWADEEHKPALEPVFVPVDGSAGGGSSGAAGGINWTLLVAVAALVFAVLAWMRSRRAK